MLLQQPPVTKMPRRQNFQLAGWLSDVSPLERRTLALNGTLISFWTIDAFTIGKESDCVEELTEFIS
jgi:hypothetical protein